MNQDGKLWQRVTHDNPCPICKRPDWCQFGDRAMKCMRVESQHACDSGGWYHFYTDEKPDFVPRLNDDRPRLDAYALMKRWRDTTSSVAVSVFAESLGVTAESLQALRIARATEHHAWAFPMYECPLQTIGIRLRNGKFKWTVTGSRQGIFIPYPPNSRGQKVVYLPEGPTSTAALLSLGLYAIGRPNCQGGAAQIIRTMKTLGLREAVVVADNDEMKRLGPRDGRPGIEGAQALQKALACRSCIWIPPSPCKDVRDFVQAGGTRAGIESDLRNKVWKNAS